MSIPGPQLTNVGPSAEDRNQYDDTFSTCPRHVALAAAPVALGQVAFVGGRVPRLLRFNTKMRFRVDSVLAVGGTVDFAIYQGFDPTNLAKTVPDFSGTAQFGTVGVKEIAIPTIDVLGADYCYFAWVRNGPALLNPAVSAAGNPSLASLLNPTTLSAPVSGSKAGTTLPATLDIYTGWTYSGLMPWFALAV